MKDIFDFGFTAVDESELEAFQQLEDVSEAADETQARLDNLYNAIQPLLTNLKKNPEKEYILWRRAICHLELVHPKRGRDVRGDLGETC